MAERVRLIAEHGVDLLTPYEDGTITTAMAATTGHPELIEFLVSRGAPRPELSPEPVTTPEANPENEDHG